METVGWMCAENPGLFVQQQDTKIIRKQILTDDACYTFDQLILVVRLDRGQRDIVQGG
jgi:hypothetical protein